MVELTEDPYVYYIYFEVEEIVEQGGFLKDGVLIEGQDQANNHTPNKRDREREFKKMRNLSVSEGQFSGNNEETVRAANDKGGEKYTPDQDLQNKREEIHLRTVMLAKQLQSERQKQKTDVGAAV